MKLLREFTGAERIGLIVWGVAALVIVSFGVIRAMPAPVSDLEAQQSMATAAWAVFWVSSLSTVGSLLALFFVWTTVRHTRETARAAIDATMIASQSYLAEHRGWLEPQEVAVADTLEWTDDSGFVLTVHPVFKNIGRTPVDVTVEGFLFAGARAFEKVDTYLQEVRHRPIDMVHRFEETVFPDATNRIRHRLVCEYDGAIGVGGLDVFVVVEAVYRLAIDLRPRVTVAAFQLNRKPFAPIFPQDGDLEPDQLTFVLLPMVGIVAT